MKHPTMSKLLAALLAAVMLLAVPGAWAQASDPDQAAADAVAAMIDAIYVQQRTQDTDAQCAAAKEGWDALTDTQKELVAGEYADPDYFGLDTGDASLDDPRNGDDIGDKEILVVSFGTSFNDSRVQDIKGIEDALQAAFPDWSVRRAFTAQIIINHVQARENQRIDNMEQALERAVANGVRELVVQPTHLMHGAEYDEMMDALEDYRDRFEKVAVAEPLLGEVGSGDAEVNSDKEAVARAVVASAATDSGYADAADAADKGTAFVLIGHGTAHIAKVTYSQMQAQMEQLGYGNVFVGTVEGEPESTSCEAVIEAVRAAGYKNVVLRPLMVVAGDHANNDMAGDDPDSWKSMFLAAEGIDQVETQITGLGSIGQVRQLYIAHTQAAIDSLAPASQGGETVTETVAGMPLEDGVYTVEFHTDSSMFQASEANDRKGTLTVRDGQATLHVSLSSKKIRNLYPGLAADAENDQENWLQPTTDTVTYSDGLSEEVNGFDIPVSAVGEEFDLALVGTKGTWYDHKVSVENPVPAAPADGSYTCQVTLSGGSGRASVESPASVSIEDGTITAVLVWGSPYYEYMIVDGVPYDPVQTEGNSTFVIPIVLDADMQVSASTVAMSQPHLVEYTLRFDGATLRGA